MARFLACLGLCASLTACSNGSSSSSNGEGGREGVAGAPGSANTGGDGGTDATGGAGGRAGAAGRRGDGSASGVGGAAATSGTGGAAGIGGPSDANTCPVIDGLTATPSVVPGGGTQSLVEVEARDPDASPDALRTRLSATTGVFDDPEASSSTYTCGAPGPADIIATATDGDPSCETVRTISIQCPDDIPVNLCPNLFTVNAIPGNVPPGEDSTEVQTRATDPDAGPLSLVTTFYAFYGTFDDSNAEDTVYRCERSGLQEICVDASDGACVKTLCTDVICPEE